MQKNFEMDEYLEITRPYKDALSIVKARIEAVQADYEVTYGRKPIHHLEERIKKRKSIQAKLEKLKLDASAENMKHYLCDVAGIRVVTYFEKDIYCIEEVLRKQHDVVLIKSSDYITDPKPNGYRSYHMVLGIPVYYVGGEEYFPVEIQFRTMCMDLWASMEHKICYKKQCVEMEKAKGDFLDIARELERIEKVLEENYLRVEGINESSAGV